MDHRDHVALLSGGVPPGGGVWADFGAGEGAFTLAVRDLAGTDATLWAVDRDRRPLGRLEAALQRSFAGTRLHLVEADFRRQLDLPVLDGIVAANSLHFVRRDEQAGVLRLWREQLAPGGRMILVEYDAEEGNRWVPYPISFDRLSELAGESGFSAPRRLGERRTRMMDRMYSALLTTQPPPHGIVEKGLGLEVSAAPTSGDAKGGPRQRWWRPR